MRFVGYYQGKRGRPQDVVCNGYVPNKLAHEVGGTKLLLKFDVLTERGPDVDAELRPDATTWFPNGEVWHWEFLTGSQTLQQVEARWKVYGKLAAEWAEYDRLTATGTEPDVTPASVLVVTNRKTTDRLVARAKPYEAFMHFALYAELMADPFGEVIRDVIGQRISLPRPVEAPEK